MGNKRAGIIIRKYGTNLILLEQGWGKSLPGTIYDIPKGHWEPGELLEDTAIREAKEEAGIEIDQNELTFLGEFPYAKGDTLALFYCEKKFGCLSGLIDRADIMEQHVYLEFGEKAKQRIRSAYRFPRNIRGLPRDIRIQELFFF